MFGIMSEPMAGGFMQQIVFLDSDTLDTGINLRRPDFPHHWQSYPTTAPDQVVERLKCASIAIINKVRIGADELAQLPELRLIALAATGSDNLDLEACRAANVAVCNIRNYSGPSVPEHAMALMLALSRNLFAWRQSLLEGRWQQSGQFCFFDHPITDLHGKRLGIIGKGTWDRPWDSGPAPSGWRFTMPRARSAPATTRTAPGCPAAKFGCDQPALPAHPLHPPSHRAGAGLMKPGALLINVGRGGGGRAGPARPWQRPSGGAGFDVASVEPPPPTTP
jgi:glycerate dehydrogenase